MCVYMYAGYCTADCRFLFYLLSVCDLLCSFCIHVYLCCTLSCCVCPFCPSFPCIFLSLFYVACIFICLSTFFVYMLLPPSLPLSLPLFLSSVGVRYYQMLPFKLWNIIMICSFIGKKVIHFNFIAALVWQPY